jgi:hypothetical protein
MWVDKVELYGSGETAHGQTSQGGAASWADESPVDDGQNHLDVNGYV